MSEEQQELLQDQSLPPAKRQKVDCANEGNNILEKDQVVSPDKYSDFVTPEELEKLREFKVLDEVKSNDENSNDEESDSSDGKSEGIPEEEIEKMLDENLPDELKVAPKPKEKPYVTRQKIVLEEKGINHFEVLPLDWIMVPHISGMPIYMHRPTRVCTMSKPYFLGKGNTRRHEIPISAIPCLAYRKALEEEQKQKEIDEEIAEQIRTGTWSTNVNQNSNTAPVIINNKSQNTMSIGENNQHVEVNDNNVVGESAVIDNADKEESRNLTDSTKIELRCPFAETREDIKTEIENKSDEVNKNQKNQIKETDIKLEIEDANDGMSNINNANENQEQGNIITETQTTVAEENTQNTPNITEVPLNHQPVVLPGGIVMPPPRVENVNTSWKTQHLSSEQVNDYCKKLFKFKTVNIMHFQRWADRRKYTKVRKTLQYPTLPDGTKLITIPAKNTPGQENGGKAAKRDWIRNMNERSYLSVFHEYVGRALQKQPVYEFKQLENASSPYQATVTIGGMQYGVGYGSSKRQAKSAAARASIHILIPEVREHLDATGEHNEETDLQFFDYVGIEDPRVPEFCAATCEPSPHAILCTCLLRNFGAHDYVHTETKKLEYQKIELTMKVGKHTATVVCKNKKTAKQRASQAILQALHPHVRSWGSLIRLYGSRSVKSCKEKKVEEQQITLLQDKARQNEPNYAVLEKLRMEMKKLRERDEAVVPIGTLLIQDELPTHSGSNLNNVDL